MTRSSLRAALRRRWTATLAGLALVALLLAACGGGAAATSTASTSGSTSNGGTVVQVAANAATATPSATSSSTTTTDSSATGSVVDVSDIVAKVNPAVVTVINQQQFRGFTNRNGGNSNGNNSNGNGDNSNNGLQTAGSGTGFIISTDGYIVTNNHVVAGSDALQVIFLDGTTVDAKLVGADSFSDLAVLKIEGTVPATVSFGDSSKLQAGDPVIAIGSALGEYTNTVTEGIISGLDRQLSDQAGTAYDHMIQHDAAINPGNSGGPLLNLQGQVIGVNTAVVRDDGEGDVAEGLGFAIPSNTVQEIVNQLIAQGSVQRPFLGIEYTMLTPQIASAQGLSVNAGALVGQVTSGGPADKAGLQENDVITAVNGTKLDQQHSLADVLLTFKPGDTVSLTINRGGQTQTLSVTLGTRPADQ
jgi:2-alkenal reductase